MIMITFTICNITVQPSLRKTYVSKSRTTITIRRSFSNSELGIVSAVCLSHTLRSHRAWRIETHAYTPTRKHSTHLPIHRTVRVSFSTRNLEPIKHHGLFSSLDNKTKMHPIVKRRKNLTPGSAKQIRILIKLAEALEGHAVCCDRLVMITVLMPCYLTFLYIAYTDFSCIWDNEHFSLRWVMFPLSIVPYYVLPCFLTFRLPGMWEGVTRQCKYEGCAPGTVHDLKSMTSS